MHTSEDIRLTQQARDLRFLKQFVALSIFLLGSCLIMLIISIASVFFAELQSASEYSSQFYRYVAPFTGFVFAEMARRRSVNPNTDNLRPYSWKELFQYSKRT